MCGYNFSENALVQGFSPHGGKSATVLERMLHYCNVTSPDVAHVYNQGRDAMSALRYRQALIPFDSCVRATAAANKGKGMTMQQIIDGDAKQRNVEAPQTVIIGNPPSALVFDRPLDPGNIYTVTYITNTETKNPPYRIQETQAPIYIRCDDDRVALYEPVAIISSSRCQTSDENFGHGVTFVKKADQEGNNHWKLLSDKIIADFPAIGKIDETNDASFFNREKVLSDFASQLCYRLVKTMSKEEAARRQTAATTT